MKAYQEFDINYFQDEDGIFTATVPAIRGCVASGKTLEETYRNAVDAIESCLEARRKVAALKLRRTERVPTSGTCLSSPASPTANWPRSSSVPAIGKSGPAVTRSTTSPNA